MHYSRLGFFFNSLKASRWFFFFLLFFPFLVKFRSFYRIRAIYDYLEHFASLWQIDLKMSILFLSLRRVEMQFNVSKMLSKVLTCFHSFQTCQWEHYVSEDKMIILRALLIILQIFF